MARKKTTDEFVAAVEANLAARDWTRTELARRMGTDLARVSRILSGLYSPSVETLERVAAAFDIDICELLCKKRRKK